ncbi:MAG TPA: lysylphosphatidylglycerol synthase transmembrane domain-containing protein [Nitrospiria bacterium]|nr:lysylphosphatidylglycerol synthase transmembrane domain-containing protein [Nitrospiria bacterium]
MKKAGWLALKLAVTVGLLAYLFSRIEVSSVARLMAGAAWGWVVAAFFLYVVLQGLCAWRWLLLARVLNLDGTWKRFVRYYYVGMFFNLFLPTGVGGDVYRCYYVARSAADWRRAIISVLADRGVGFATMCAIAAVATLAFGRVELPSEMGWALGVGVLALVALLAGGLAARSRFASVWASMPLVVEFFRRPGTLAVVTALSFLLQSLVVVVTVFNAKALGLDVPLVFYFILIPLIAVATLLPVSLNGLGVREVAFVFFLGQVGVPKDQALSLALLWLVVLTAASAIGGLVWLATPVPRKPPEPGVAPAG